MRNKIINYVEDEKDLNNLVRLYLEKEGYKVNSYYAAAECLDMIRRPADLWILDIMLPGELTGLDLLTMIKNFNSETPVIITSARDLELDRITGLEMGGDDYLTKPFSPKELVLRVKNCLRRNRGEVREIVEYKEYTIHLNKRLVLNGNDRLKLTSKEFNLLRTLVQNRNKPLSREQLLMVVWETTFLGTDRIVDDLLRRLRKKMPSLDIETIYGFGYRLI